MPNFKIGDRVMLIGLPDQKGFITKVLIQHDGIYYDIIFDDGTLSSYSELQIESAFQAADPWLLFAKNEHKGYEDFGLITTFHKVRNTTNNTLSTLLASRTEFKAFQYKPLIKFLNSTNRRILVADEVGLGKTIEAGHIMLEMAGRGELKNAVIICPKSLKEKWQAELKDKFNFNFKIINSKRDLLNDFNHSLSSGTPFKVIITYGSIRTMTNERRDLTQENNPFILELLKTNQFIDLLICDEAHYVRNPNLSHRGLRKLTEAAKAVVFLTATPLMTGIDNLYHILSILDNEMFYDKTVFQNEINLNKPFIKALLRLNNRENLKEIGNELLNSEITEQINIGKEFSIERKGSVKDYFVNNSLFDRVIHNLMNGENKPSMISEIQKDLTDLNSLNYLYTRSRKKEVLTDGKIATRNSKSYFVELTDEERTLYNKVIEDYAGDPLALVTKKRAVSSCIPAYFATEEELRSGQNYDETKDSKFEFLWQIINEVVIKNDRKLIVFAYFTKTLLYLKNKIENKGIKCSLMYGPSKNRQAIIDEFRENKEIKIFLSSQVGTEGVDLQFCNALVNYDLPWNPMIVEQRIGRIDRIGQKEDIVHIYTIVLNSTIEAQIYNRLLLRINIFREAIGDLESILSEEDSSIETTISKLENELYGTKLTDEQVQMKIDAVALAIENEKNTLELIKNELTDSVVNDIYFQNEINNIKKNQQYITKQDVIFYIKWFIRVKFPNILFNQVEDEVFEFIFPRSNTNKLISYLQENLDLDKNKELLSLFQKFRNRTFGNQKLQVTFDQKFASEHPNIDYINAYHPLMIAITNYIESNQLHLNQIYKFSLPRVFLSNEEFNINSGDYLMCVYKITIVRSGKNANKKFEYLHPVVLDANTQDIIFLSKEESQFFFGISQQHNSDINSDIEFNEEIIEFLRPKFQSELNKVQRNYEKEENLKLDSFKQRNIKQLEQYYKSRIQRIKEQIEERDPEDKIIPVFRKNLEDVLFEFNQKEEWIVDTKLHVKNALISISYVQVT